MIEDGDLAHSHLAIVTTPGSPPSKPNPNDIRELVSKLFFTFEILDEIGPQADPAYDYRADLLSLEDLWLEKLAPYECGMPAVGDARERQSVKFYMVAMIFLLFDIEVAFLYPWAMALRDLGWNGFAQVLLFMGLLLAGYIYVWRKGALDWGNENA